MKVKPPKTNPQKHKKETNYPARPFPIRNKILKKKNEVKEKLYTYHTYTQQDHNTEGVTLWHFGQQPYVALIKHCF